MSLYLDDDRLLELLARAEQLSLELRASEPTDQKALMANLDIVHHDIGRLLHELWASSVSPSQDLDQIDQLEPLDDTPPKPVDPTAWVFALQDLLALIQPPIEDDHPILLAIECGRVQWATSDLGERWPVFPIPIQQALLGMFAARCRWLQQNLLLPDGAERALARLERYRRTQGLSKVVGLSVGAEPESDSWPGDAVYWWEMLASSLP